MALIEEFEASGNRLFRWRSYIPLVLYVAAALLIVFEHDRHLPHFSITWSVLCLFIALQGLAVRILTVGYTPRGTSGRNTREGQVAEQLNTRGIYSCVRHPLYLGNFFMWLGLVVYTGNWWFTGLFCLAYWLYYERIMFAEESFLRRKFGSSFEKWSEQTNAFWPRFSQWQKPGWHFSWRNVLKREYNGFFALFLSFALIDVLKNYIRYGYITFFELIDPLWLWCLIFSLVLFLVLRFLKKRTSLLNESGREYT